VIEFVHNIEITFLNVYTVYILIMEMLITNVEEGWHCNLKL